MPISAPSPWSSALSTAQGVAAQAGTDLDRGSKRAEDALHGALQPSAGGGASPVDFFKGAAEGLADVPLDLGRAVGGGLSLVDPANAELESKAGIPVWRALMFPKAFFSDLAHQFGRDFAKAPARTVGYALANPLGEAARLDAEAAGGPEVRTLQVPVPGTQRSLPVSVYTPAGVKDTRDLPVVYFLHGTPGAPGNFLRDGGKSALDAWFRAGHPPFKFVEPDGNVPGLADSEWVNSPDVNPNRQVESYLMRSVIPAVEGTEPRDRSHRLIIGYSMGGYGAMNIALHHPEAFAGVASLEGYYHVDDTDGMLTASPRPQGPSLVKDPGGPGMADPAVVDWNSPDHQVARARGLGILLIGGKSDTGVSRGESERMSALLNAQHIPNTLQMVPGGHLPNTLGSQMTSFFRWIESQQHR